MVIEVVEGIYVDFGCERRGREPSTAPASFEVTLRPLSARATGVSHSRCSVGGVSEEHFWLRTVSRIFLKIYFFFISLKYMFINQ